MPKGISIHLAVPEPQQGCGKGTPLKGAANAAGLMAEIAGAAGFTAGAPVMGDEATAARLDQELQAAAEHLTRGDILLLTFAGHGCQRVTETPNAEPDRRDEAWCLADGELWDDQLYGMWGRFARGVRVVVISECCHSQGMDRAAKELAARSGGDGASGDNSGPARPRRPRRCRMGHDLWRAKRFGVIASNAGSPIKAQVLFLSASADEEEAEDGVPYPLFTTGLKTVWNGGLYPLGRGYGEFIREIEAWVRPRATEFDQTPTYARIRVTSDFLNQRPFQI